MTKEQINIAIINGLKDKGYEVLELNPDLLADFANITYKLLNIHGVVFNEAIKLYEPCKKGKETMCKCKSDQDCRDQRDSDMLKVGKVKEFWQFKNTYLIDKQLNKDSFGFRKDLTDIELVDKYALYLKNNL